MASQYGTIHTNKPITNLLIGYNPDNFVGNAVAPAVPVKKQSDTYYIYSSDSQLRIDDYERKSGAESVEVTPMTTSTDTYFCKKYSAKAKITDDDKANSDNPPIKLKEHSAIKLKNKILRKREYDIASTLFNTATFAGKTTAITGSDRWDESTSYPIDQVLDYSSTISTTSGYAPNTLIMGADVFKSLKTHPQFTNYVGASQDKNITTGKMAEAFGIPRILVGDAIYNTAKEGQTKSNAKIWGKYVLLAYIAPNVAIDMPSLIYSFRWSMGKGSSELVKEWREEKLESDFIEYTISYDDKIISTDLGYLLSTVVS